MNTLVDDGFVVRGGPLSDGEKILLIIDAESEQEIDARLADDPWTPLGLLRMAKVEHWEILQRKLSGQTTLMLSTPSRTIHSYSIRTILPNQVFMVIFTRPGTYPYYCNIHTYMVGTIIVTP